MSSINRRKFLRSGSLAALPALLPIVPILAAESPAKQAAPSTRIIKLSGDGEMFEPGEYLQALQQVHTAAPIVKDRYGSGGAVEALEKKFASITGKARAIYMPSGTMANQLAIAVLSGDRTKVYVQETSHYYRDEADAAQTVYQKRLMPLAAGETYFTAAQLQQAIEGLKNEEVFATGIGAVAVENPVRRTAGKMVPLEEIKKISAYCRSKNIPLHLDGARLFMASAWSGVSIKEYASYFDTVYISLYKYLGASAGAILCGDTAVIDQMPHLIKVHGGSMYGNWTNAAMALHRLEGFEGRLKQSIRQANTIFTALNKLPGIKINPVQDGTNIYTMTLAKGVDGKKLQQRLQQEYNIRMAGFNEKNEAPVWVNETLLYQEPDYIIAAFSKSI